MKEPVRISLAIVVAIAALSLAYFAGTYTARPQPEASSELSPLMQPEQLDFARAMEAVDYDGLVESIAAIRIEGEKDGFVHFYGVVDTLHRAVLLYIAQRLDLTEVEHERMMKEYAGSSDNILINYQQMMGAMKGDSIATAPEAVVSHESYNAVNEFLGIFSGHACGLLAFPGLSPLKQASGLVDDNEAKGVLDVRLTCRNILTEAIGPIGQTLRAKAVIRDLNTSRLNIESQVRSMVVELATAEEPLSADFTDF